MTTSATPALSRADRAFCGEMLPKVSRTFAICIRLLPEKLDHSVLVAYLLCRVADTVEDSTRLLPTEQERLLEAYRHNLDGEDPEAGALAEAFRHPGTHEERLAEEAATVLREFRRLPDTHQQAIRPWVQQMCQGMADFVGRRRGAPRESIESLATVEELDRYCYFVAGTVGHLLTDLFLLHRPMAVTRQRRLKSLATSFGLGLQLTNIIKDVADDRRRGWSFVPRQLCQFAGIRPEDLQNERHRDSARRVMRMLIDKARGHLRDALDYTTALPRYEYGIRTFCLTSLYFAVRTLRLAEGDRHLLDPDHKVKITRGEVYRTILATRVVAPVNSLVRAYFHVLAGGDTAARRVPA